MKVDLYFGKDTNAMFGMNRCKLELLKALPNKVDVKKIAYSPKNRILNYFDFITYAPSSVIKGRRNDAIAHILSQSEAHLLNFFKFKKSVVLCYDIIPVVLDYGTKLSRAKARFSYRGMVKADHIIAISHFTKQEIVRVLGYPKNRITVAHLGVDHDLYKPIEDTEKVREKYNLSDNNKYLIFVGNEEPRMNLDTLLSALKKSKEKYPNLKLIKVGKPNFPGAREKLQEQIKKLGLENDVIFTGYIPEEDMPVLLNIADISIYLCSYAGFGLPPLEAMACGTPTITSNVSSLPELTQSGAITIDPKDVEAVTKAIDKILSSEELRNKLKEEGIKHAQKFRWENFINVTLKVYDQLNKE